MNFNELDFEGGPKRLGLNQDEFPLIFDGRHHVIWL